MKQYLSAEEIDGTGFILISSDGIGGDSLIAMSEHKNEEGFDTLFIEENFKEDGAGMMWSEPFAGIHISLDYIDLTNPSGNSYNEKDMIKNTAIARAFSDTAIVIPSSWEWANVAPTIITDILPGKFQKDYRANTAGITRADFCELAFALLAETNGLKPDAAQDVPFNDTNNLSAAALYGQGIIQGRGEGVFAPDGAITREEAAVILYRMYVRMGIRHDIVENPHERDFSDDAEISGCAKESVYEMRLHEILSGTENDRFSPDDMFSPKGTLTAEQAIVTMLRLYRLMFAS
jgi:hypothetical protein